MRAIFKGFGKVVKVLLFGGRHRLKFYFGRNRAFNWRDRETVVSIRLTKTIKYAILSIMKL